MIRFIIKSTDMEAAAHVAGAEAHHYLTSIDLTVPMLEAFMAEPKGRMWLTRQLVGIEYLPDQKPA